MIHMKTVFKILFLLALAGVVIKFGPVALFGSAGGLLICVAIVAGLRHRSWSLDMLEAPADGELAAAAA